MMVFFEQADIVDHHLPRPMHLAEYKTNAGNTLQQIEMVHETFPAFMPTTKVLSKR